MYVNQNGFAEMGHARTYVDFVEKGLQEPAGSAAGPSRAAAATAATRLSVEGRPMPVQYPYWIGPMPVEHRCTWDVGRMDVGTNVQGFRLLDHKDGADAVGGAAAAEAAQDQITHFKNSTTYVGNSMWENMGHRPSYVRTYQISSPF